MASATSTTTSEDTTTTGEETTTTSTFSHLPADIIRAHILPRLDGCSLAAVGCTTPELRSLAFGGDDGGLWADLCHSMWPSTTMLRMRELISTFPNGPRSFFSLSYPLFPTLSPILYPPSLPGRIISAVDIFYRGRCIFSKVHETETVTGWFRCSPFRVDLLGPKETVATPIRRPRSHEDTCRELMGDLELSWIVVDPVTCRCVNVSSWMPVTVERNWLSGEVHVRYAVVMGHVMCGVEVTCVGGMGPVMHVTEVSMKMEDMDGAHLVGRESLVILQRVFEGKRGNDAGRRDKEEGRRRYMEYLERKRERKERKARTEGRLDMICVGFGVLALFAAIFFSFGYSR